MNKGGIMPWEKFRLERTWTNHFSLLYSCLCFKIAYYCLLHASEILLLCLSIEFTKKKCLLFSNYASWSSIISVCLVKISVCSGKISVWYTFPGKISVCSRFSRELGSRGSGFLTACYKDLFISFLKCPTF